MIALERKNELMSTRKSKIYNDHQASINSDGCITLRNYNKQDPGDDEIIILSKQETNEIKRLFHQIHVEEDREEGWLPF